MEKMARLVFESESKNTWFRTIESFTSEAKGVMGIIRVVVGDDRYGEKGRKSKSPRNLDRTKAANAIKKNECMKKTSVKRIFGNEFKGGKEEGVTKLLQS